MRYSWLGSGYIRPREWPDFCANGASVALSAASISSRDLRQGKGSESSRESLREVPEGVPKCDADIGSPIVSLLTLRLLACYRLLARLGFTALPGAAVYDRAL